MTQADMTPSDLSRRYDGAAARWRDEMRALGYYDGYLGFLSAPEHRPAPNARVIDVGAGTAAMAEAWTAVNGTPGDLLLVDISSEMLARGQAILAPRGISPRILAAGLDADLATRTGGPADEVLAAHLIEHCADPEQALCDLRTLLAPGGKLRLVVSKPHWCNAIIWMQWRHRTFGLNQMRDMLTRSGFRIDAEYDFPAGPPSRTSRGFVATPI